MDDESVKVSGGILLVRSKSGTNKIHKVLVHTKRGKGRNQVKCRLQKLVQERRRASKIPVYVRNYKRGIGRRKTIRSLHASVTNFSKNEIQKENAIIENPPQEGNLQKLTKECCALESLKKNKKYPDSGIATSVSDEAMLSTGLNQQVFHFQTKHIENIKSNDSELLGYNKKCSLFLKELWSQTDSSEYQTEFPEINFSTTSIASGDSELFQNEEKPVVSPTEGNQDSIINFSDDDDDFESDEHEKFVQSQKPVFLLAEPHTIVMSQYETSLSTLMGTRKTESEFEDESEESSVESHARFIDSGLRPLKSDESRLYLDIWENRRSRSSVVLSEEDGVYPLLMTIPAELYQPKKTKTKPLKKKSVFDLPSAATLSVAEMSTPDLQSSELIDTDPLKKLQEFEDTTFTITTDEVKKPEEGTEVIEEPEKPEEVIKPDVVPQPMPVPKEKELIEEPEKPAKAKKRIKPDVPQPMPVSEEKDLTEEPERSAKAKKRIKPDVPQPMPVSEEKDLTEELEISAKAKKRIKPDLPQPEEKVIEEPERPAKVKKRKRRVIPQPTESPKEEAHACDYCADGSMKPLCSKIVDALTGNEDCACPHYHELKKVKKKKSIFKIFEGDVCFHASEPSDQAITSADMSCSSIPNTRRKSQGESEENIKVIKAICPKSKKGESGVKFVVEECSSGKIPKTSTVKKKKPGKVKISTQDKHPKTEDGVGETHSDLSKKKPTRSSRTDDSKDAQKQQSGEMKKIHQKHSQSGRSLSSDIHILLPGSSAVLIPAIELCGKSSCKKPKTKESKDASLKKLPEDTPMDKKPKKREDKSREVEPPMVKKIQKDLKHKQFKDEKTLSETNNSERHDKSVKKETSISERSTALVVGENKESQTVEAENIRTKSRKDKHSKSRKPQRATQEDVLKKDYYEDFVSSEVKTPQTIDSKDIPVAVSEEKDVVSVENQRDPIKVILPHSAKKEIITPQVSNLSFTRNKSKSQMNRDDLGPESSGESVEQPFLESNPLVSQKQESTENQKHLTSSIQTPQEGSRNQEQSKLKPHVTISPEMSKVDSKSSLTHDQPQNSVFILSSKERRGSKMNKDHSTSNHATSNTRSLSTFSVRSSVLNSSTRDGREGGINVKSDKDIAPKSLG